MRIAPFTEADVNSLIDAPKFLGSKREDNRGQPNVREIRLTYEVRKREDAENNLRLQFFTRLELMPHAGLVQAYPGASLLWYNHKIRCLCWKLKREIVQDGEVKGFLTGWYEHIWTDADRDRYVIDVDDSSIPATDFDSVFRFCCDRWNIEKPAQLTFGDLS